MFECLVFIATLATLIAGYVALSIMPRAGNPDLVQYIRDRAKKAESVRVEPARNRLGDN